MNFRTIGRFVNKYGKDILAKSAVAVGVIVSLTLLSDDSGVEEEDTVFEDWNDDDVEVIEGTAEEVTGGEN